MDHGLVGTFTFLPSEDPQRFQDMAKTLRAEYKPETATEALLVHNLARYQWLIERALRLQDECLMASQFDDKKLGLLLRYQATQERAFHRTFSELIKLRKQRRQEELDAEKRHREKWARPLDERIREGDMEAIQIALEIGRKPHQFPWHIRKMLGFLPEETECKE